MKTSFSTSEYWIASEPRGAAFEALLTYCAAIGSYCTLVDRFPQARRGREAREQFFLDAEPHLLGIEDTKSWPGTNILKGTVPLWRFALSGGLIDLMLSRSKGLYDFQEPKLPEDLAVYRSDGSVLLGSVAHEHMGWMNLSADERSDRRLGLVELRLGAS